MTFAKFLKKFLKCMDSNLTGSIEGSRIGSVPVIHSFPIDLNLESGINKSFCKIPGTLNYPIAFKASLVIEKSNDAITSATFTLGGQGGGSFSDGDNNLFSGVDLRASPQTNYVSDPIIRECNDTLDIVGFIEIDGAATQGLAWLIIEVFKLHPGLDGVSDL